MKANLKLRWGILFSSLFMLTALLGAQPGPGKGPHHGGPGTHMPDSCRAKHMMDNLTKDLSLSADQQQKITAIHKAHFEKMKAMREQDSICMARNREQHMQMRSDMDNEIKALLNAEQKSKYDSIMADRRGPDGDCPRHRRKHGN